VSPLRAVSVEGAERPSPSSWAPSGISLHKNGVSSTQIVFIQNLSFIPEVQRKKACSGLTTTGTPNNPHLIYLSFYSLLMEELSQPSKGRTQNEKVVNVFLRLLSLFFFPPVMVIGFVIMILPLCMWENLPGAGHRDRKEFMATWWTRLKIHFLREHTTHRRAERSCFTDGGQDVLFSVRN